MKMLHLKFTLPSIAKTMSVRRKSITNDEHEHQASGRRKCRQVDMILIQIVALSTWLTFSHGCQHDCMVRPLFDFVPAAATGMPQLSRRVVANTGRQAAYGRALRKSYIEVGVVHSC